MGGEGSRSGEIHCSDGSLGNESSCGALGPHTQTLVPTRGGPPSDCLPQAGRYISCLSGGFEGCDEAVEEHHECLVRMGNRLVRYKHGYLFLSTADQLLSASVELYGIGRAPATVVIRWAPDLTSPASSHLTCMAHASLLSSSQWCEPKVAPPSPAGEWSEHELQTCMLFLGREHEVVEVGTRGGAHFAPMSRAVGPAGSIVGIESESNAWTIASGTGVVNTIFNVRIVHAEAGESDHVDSRGGKHVSIDGLALVRPRLLKLHCGQGVNEVIMGAQSTIASYKPAVYMDMAGALGGMETSENHRRNHRPEQHGVGGDGGEKMMEVSTEEGEGEGVHYAECEPGLQMLFSLGYRCWVDTLPSFNPDNFHQNAENYFVHQAPARMLLCATSEGVESLPKVLERVEAMQAFWCRQSKD